LPGNGKKSLAIDPVVHRELSIESATTGINMADLIATAWSLYKGREAETGVEVRSAPVSKDQSDYADFVAHGQPEVVRVVQDLVAAHAKARKQGRNTQTKVK
jgi:hypothetical protein